jgi:phenylalanyl-tRNA synthetase beta chain
LPVVRIELGRFTKMVGTDRKKVIDRLPYIGLDIESVSKDSVRVEYSPNRPDLGTDYGIARALRGLLGKEVGLPRFPTRPSGIWVSVDRKLSTVRPYITCAVAAGLHLDDEDVRQIISLQEDLHNGLGRRRKKVAIGLHDLDAVKPPISYRAVGPTFGFTPLGASSPSTISSILSDTYEGRAYGPIFSGSEVYPVITDSKGAVLSFPPIINGNVTKVTKKTKNIFVDVTSTEEKVGDEVMAVMATTLAEAGGKLGTVTMRYPSGTRTTPNLAPVAIPLDYGLIGSVLGLDLSRAEVLKCLAKSRMGAQGKKALGPRYRVDLLHPVDVAEEVALGYGTDMIQPLYPPSNRPGSFNGLEVFLDSVSTVMAGAGMIEMMTYELTDVKSLYTSFGRSASERISVHDPKSLEHSVLRDSLVPTLMAALSGNVKSDYPQRVFEIGRVYARSKGTVSESWHLGCLVAHSQSSFTEAKMYLGAACRILSGREGVTRSSEHWAFAKGRCAAVGLGKTGLGFTGELAPEVVDAFRIGVPISGFELDLTKLYGVLK